MSDEYLWDRSGEPDPLVVELEGKLSGLAFEPVFVVEAAAPDPSAMPRPSPRWRAYAIGSAVTAAAVACSAVLFWCGYRAGQDVPPPAPAVQPVVAEVPDAPPLDPVEPPARVEPPQLEREPEAEPEPETPPEPMRTADARTGRNKTRARGRSKGGAEPVVGLPRASGSSSSSASSSSAKKTEALDVDCVLDPERCRGAKVAPPERLSTTDIRNGIAPVKEAARACGPEHGAARGERVKVKLTIEGATGAVTSARAEAPHTGTPLGQCVAAALAKARFPRFLEQSLGAVYPVTM